jgi:hypothetical protein
MNKETMNKQPPTLEQRIVGTLNNPNAGSEALAELIEKVESAALASVETAEAERTRSLDLVLCPDPREARERIAAAELNGERLRTQLPKLRDKLSAALRSESHERWLSDFSRVRQQLSDAASLFRDYRQHAEALVRMFYEAEQVDKEISRINGSAPDGEHRRLRSVELEARNKTAFTRDNPSLAATVDLRDWDNSGRKLWPLTSSGSLAAAFAGMAIPYHPGANWADADEQSRRRAEIDKQHHRIGDFYQHQTEDQEERINAEERERFAASRRAT